MLNLRLGDRLENMTVPFQSAGFLVPNRLEWVYGTVLAQFGTGYGTVLAQLGTPNGARSVKAQKSFPGPEMACTQLPKSRAIFPFLTPRPSKNLYLVPAIWG